MKEISDEEYEEYLSLKNKTDLNKEYHKQYYGEKVKFKTRRCEICELDVSYFNFVTHLKTKKHQKNLEIIKLKKLLEK